MNIRRKLRAHTEVHTGPLNDILFILLLFFLIASTLANPNVIRVNNPRASKDMKAKQTIVVSVNKDHQYFLGQTPVDYNALDTLLKVQIENARKYIDTPSVTINADTIAYWGEIVRIMSVAKKYKVKVGANVK
ncbi:MAG TPA: biopolymer transporter ExbD [Flavisolibacter sp.]|nr:biopolymer transporter ExbD [Flavisolibacter sp.]